MDGMTAVTMRWELVRLGDTVLDPDGNEWLVQASRPQAGQWFSEVTRGSRGFQRFRNLTDTVRVLVPTETAASVATLRAGLGPVRVLDRA